MVHIRPAKRSDAADIAILDDIASSGLASYVLQQGVADGRYNTPMEFGRDGYAFFVDSPYSWKNALIAEIEGDVAGSLLAFALTGGPGDSGLVDPVLEPIDRLKARAVGTRFIDSLAVYTRYRGNGVGKALVQAELARADGAVSLLTDSNNERALTLYRSLGFAEVERRPVVPLSQGFTAKEWVLLMRPAASSKERSHG